MNQLAIFDKPKDLLGYLQSNKAAISMALPKHLTPDRMLRLALTCFSTTPALRKCTGQSILSSLVIASQLGLEPGVSGQAYLIPYKETCTLVPGWQGLVGLLNNSGRATAWTGAVYEGDLWEFELGSRPKCRHVPGMHSGDPSKLIWVYACGQVNGSDHPVVEAWPIPRVLAHRDKYNKVGKAHYSYQHLEMYARKVVVLQVLKYMPKSIELSNAMTAANASEAGIRVEVQDGTVIEVPAEQAVPEPDAFPAAKKQAGVGVHDVIYGKLDALKMDEGIFLGHLERLGVIEPGIEYISHIPEETAKLIDRDWAKIMGKIHS